MLYYTNHYHRRIDYKISGDGMNNSPWGKILDIFIKYLIYLNNIFTYFKYANCKYYSTTKKNML